jgi:hypothetical protein
MPPLKSRELSLCLKFAVSYRPPLKDVFVVLDGLFHVFVDFHFDVLLDIDVQVDVDGLVRRLDLDRRRAGCDKESGQKD